jgi:hypothetical protein
LLEKPKDFLGLVALGPLPFVLGVLQGGFVGLEEEDQLAGFAWCSVGEVEQEGGESHAKKGLRTFGVWLPWVHHRMDDTSKDEATNRRAGSPPLPPSVPPPSLLPLTTKTKQVNNNTTFSTLLT